MAINVRTNYAAVSKLLATNKLLAPTSQRAAAFLKSVPQARSDLCWQQAGVKRAGLSAVMMLKPKWFTYRIIQDFIQIYWILTRSYVFLWFYFSPESATGSKGQTHT